jgi:elongation factor G
LLFSDEVVGGHIPGQLVQSVKKGFLGAAERGVLAGFPVVDVIGTVYDGKTHPVDSKDIAFQIAGRMGFKESCRAAKPVLLEPIMNVSIRVPMEQMGAITGDLNSRRGRILGMSPEAGYQVIKAQVPMAELLRYSTELRSMTGGAGEFSMEFDRYEEVPAMLAQKVVEAHKKEKEEEEE